MSTEAVTTVPAAEGASRKPLQLFKMPASDWWLAVLTMLSLSLTTLRFPPGYLMLLVMFIVNYRQHRYDFIIQTLFFCGGYAFIDHHLLPIHVADIGLAAGCVCCLLYRKNGPVKKITIAMLLYFAALVAIAKTSDEKMSTQLIAMRPYLMMMFMFVPMASFAGRQFDIMLFFRKVILYSLVCACFYIIDGLILNGWVLVPASYINEYVDVSTIYNLVFRFFPRKYPPGLYIMGLALYPVIYYYRLPIKYWVMIGLSFITCRTISFIASLVLPFPFFKGTNIKKYLKYAALGIAGIVAVYFVDRALGGVMRVSSTVEQFMSLDAAVDEEDVAEFGSGRMAQIIPKWDLLTSLNREWLGLGFLHPTLTTNPKYIIRNELYSDITKSEEVATAVEETHIQTILNVGFVGLIIQFAFYIYTYIAVRRLRFSKFYLLVMIVINIAGIGGFEGFTQAHGLFILATALAAVILANRPNSIRLTDPEAEDDADERSDLNQHTVNA